MANSYKDIVITPNRGSSSDDPKIVFSGANTTVNTDITLRAYPESNGTLSFEGSAGQLFSITNDLTGSIFSVNDVSGIPLIDVNVTSQLVTLVPFYGNVSIGSGIITTSGSSFISQKTVKDVPIQEYNTQAQYNTYKAFIRSTNANNTFTLGRLADSTMGFYGYFNSTTANQTDFYAVLDNFGIWIVSSEVRGTLFRDTNNTAYYVDPLSTSVMNSISMQGNIQPSTVNNTGGGTWNFGTSAWGGNVSGANSVTGMLYSAGAGSQLFTFASGPGQMSVQADGSLFAGGSPLGYNPHSLTAASDGFVACSGGMSSGGIIYSNASVRAPIFYDSDDTNVRWDNNVFVLRGASPSIFLRDTDGTTAALHCNSNIFYILRGTGDTETMTQVNSQWPLYINLTNNDAVFGGNLTAAGNMYSPYYYDSNDTGYYTNPAGTSVVNDIIINNNIATPANYYDGLQMEIRATSGTAGIGLHRNGNSHCGIYHDTINTLKFNFNTGTVTLNGSAGTLWGSGNDGAGSGLDADLLDGLNASSAAGASTIVARDANGYIFSNYINTTDDVNAGTISNIVAKFGDNYHRSASAAKVASFISGQTMNIVGSASSVTNALTINNGGAGSASGTTYNGSAAVTISHNSIGAVPTGRTIGIVQGTGVTVTSSGSLDLTANRSWTIAIGQDVSTSAAPTFAGETLTGLSIGRTASVANVSVSNDTGSYSARGSTTAPAVMSFHRAGAYAINMGLDTDNVFKIGGWSDGVNTYRLQLATSSGTSTINSSLNVVNRLAVNNASPGSRFVVTNATAGLTVAAVQGVAGNLTLDFNGGGGHYYDAGAHYFRNFAGTIVASISASLVGTGNRLVYSDANGQLTNTASDLTLKTNIEPISHGLDAILQLNPISFNWKDHVRFGSQREIGFGAQEVQQVIPEVIGVNAYDDTLSVDYPKLTAALTKAVQELSAKLDSLKNEFDQYKSSHP